ncbi:MAG TPA: lysylphosphatidylglycerol synthase domain-containing protein, partial [Candidatus Polarisedimenticolia bacterium]|nr:lysylphosphatidylglycerol synthase domain-containing protein [Candidatus Polarisedimenticolia bacterium]
MSTTASTIAGSGSRRGRPYLRLVFTLAVTALAVWFLWSIFSEVGLAHVWDRILAADPALFVLATAITVARFWLLALRWEILVRREAPVGMRQITPVLMAGNFVSLVMPALRVAGPILRAYYLSRETGRPRARFYGTIVAD